MQSLQQIIRDILLTFNPISLFIAVGLVMLVYLLMLSRSAEVKNRRGFFRNLILPLTIILPLLVSLVFFLITSIFIEWPNSYNEAIWTQKNGKWVRSTKPVFHIPFSFGGYRETTSNTDRYSAMSEPFLLKYTEHSVPVLTRLTVTTAADYSLMQTFCEQMGLTIQMGESARRGRTLIEKRLNQFIKVATQPELIDIEHRQKALSGIFIEYGMKVIEIGLSTD